MNHRLDAAPVVVAARAIDQEAHQIVGRNDVGDLVFGDIAPLVTVAEPVGNDNSRHLALVEGGDQIRAYETGTAGDDDHAPGYRVCFSQRESV